MHARISHTTRTHTYMNARNVLHHITTRHNTNADNTQHTTSSNYKTLHQMTIHDNEIPPDMHAQFAHTYIQTRHAYMHHIAFCTHMHNYSYVAYIHACMHACIHYIHDRQYIHRYLHNIHTYICRNTTQRIASHCIASHHITSHYITFQCITSHHITSYHIT